ncbi:MAG TPA: UbiA family prenyltransferase [Nocardioides sp.]|jgi:4-hydroxybenzoate polyprenyltransferase|uniref:UbiA family prenyltransferase n=1 Tax=Nocardioides sp. TaxID=35761 RepID=UPI002E37383D|nr:UbiA family prenyltransferase [Nocardioides sp.]HEX3932726.1 UbiA family prenyltransferase [Nocardioides sp.]
MPAPSAEPEPEAGPAARKGGLARLTPVLLLRAAHPQQAVLTALALAAAAALSGRPAREVGLVAATVLVGQAVLGWDNDLTDERTDRADERQAKPLVAGPLDRGGLGFALACAVLLVVPLALSGGIDAGLAYLLSIAIGAAGNRVLRGSAWSWLPWAAAFALYPAYLSYGGWGGAARGHPPTIAMTAASALLGIGVHVLTSLSGLVDDNRDGRRHLPLRLALRVGAPRLLVLACGYGVVLLAAMALIGATVGLSQ